jgi:hypothetical protein
MSAYRPKYPFGLGATVAFGNSGGSSSNLEVQDEGVSVENAVTVLNFIGADVQVLSGGTGIVQIYIPPPTFASHFNTQDGTTTAFVSESIARSTARISTPTSEGNPFSTNGWAGTNKSSSLNSTATFTTGANCTGFGGNSTMTVTVYDADGTTALESKTTTAINANGSYGSGNITITITGYSADTTRFKATPTVTVDIGAIFTSLSKQGGRYHVVVSQTVDTATDGSGTYTYTQTDVFYDTNPNTPSVGTTTIAETNGNVVTKHLSGIEYYTSGSQFSVSVASINNLNRNTARTSNNLSITFANYGIGNLSQSPFGTGSTNFSGWTNAFDNTNASYQKTNSAISSSNFRYRGTGANVSSQARDTWNNGSSSASSNSSLLIDTYGVTSTNLIERFDDENRRQSSNFNTGSTSGNWNSTTSLVAGEALVLNGKLMIPSVATLSDGSTNANFSTYSPTAGGANPNYSSLTSASNYYRTIVDSTGSSRAGFSIVFSGNFISNATTDLANSDLEIFISKIASSTGGNTGYNNPYFLNIHGALYNFASFNDGVTNGQIREGSSSGNTVNCTFGGFVCEDGFYMRIKINDSRIKIDTLTVSFS